MKPRTNYSSNVLRRAVPNVNIQQKKDSITMVKLKVLTSLKLGKRGDDDPQMPRKVKTVQQIPKILSFVSPGQGRGDQLMKVVSGIGIQEVIDEEKAGLGDFSDSDDDIGGIKKKSKRSKSSSSSEDSGAGGSEDSSIDAGCEDDEEKLYQ